jgi:hypothetical protein
MLALRTMRILAAKMLALILCAHNFEYRTSGRPQRSDAAERPLDPLKTAHGELSRCSAQWPLEVGSSHLVQLAVQGRDFVGALAIVGQVGGS